VINALAWRTASIITALVVWMTSATCLCNAARPKSDCHRSSCCASTSENSPKHSNSAGHQCLHCQGAPNVINGQDKTVVLKPAVFGSLLLHDLNLLPASAHASIITARSSTDDSGGRSNSTLLRLHCALTI
jgi:hypothetical protein